MTAANGIFYFLLTSGEWRRWKEFCTSTVSLVVVVYYIDARTETKLWRLGFASGWVMFQLCVKVQEGYRIGSRVRARASSQSACWASLLFSQERHGGDASGVIEGARSLFGRACCWASLLFIMTWFYWYEVRLYMYKNSLKMPQIDWFGRYKPWLSPTCSPLYHPRKKYICLRL